MKANGLHPWGGLSIRGGPEVRPRRNAPKSGRESSHPASFARSYTPVACTRAHISEYAKESRHPMIKCCDQANMERASKLIRGLGLPADTITAEQLVCAAWANAVGRKVAGHTRATRMVRTRLIVEVEDTVWQRQLWALRGQILGNLEKHVGPGLVDDLEFRIVPRRRQPQRETAAASGASSATPLLDEADGIADPVLRSIYRAARKKALA
jgi:hypothetical protein